MTDDDLTAKEVWLDKIKEIASNNDKVGNHRVRWPAASMASR